MVKELLHNIKINFTQKSLSENFNQSNFKLLSRSLDYYRVGNLTVRFNIQQLLETNFPAIAHCQIDKEAYFVILQNLKNNQLTYYQEGIGEVTEDIDKFTQKWSGTVVLLAPDAQSGEPNYEQNLKEEKRERITRWVLWGSIALIFLLSFVPIDSIWEGVIKILYALGAGVSVLLLKTEYGQNIRWVEQLCSSKTDKQVPTNSCNQVIQSAGAKVWGIGWAEIGLVYFGGGFLSLLLLPTQEQHYLLPILSYFAGLFVPFSLYYQGFVVKSWCTLCLIIQGIIILLVFAWWSNSHDSLYQFPTLANFQEIIGFTILLVFWLLYKPLWKAESLLHQKEKELDNWKQDTDLFLAHLYAQPFIELLPLAHEVQIGKIDAPIIIIMVSNPSCNPCKLAYEELTGWQRYFEDEMQVRIRYINSGEDKYKSHEIWAKEVGIAYTPTIYMNGHELKSPYTVKDIWRYIRVLSEIPKSEEKYTT